MILQGKQTPIVYTSIDTSGVRLTIRIPTEHKKRRMTEQTFWEAILREFSRSPNIEFAYPTQRFYDRIREEPSLSTEHKTDGEPC